MSKKIVQKNHIDCWKYGGELEPHVKNIFNSFHFSLNLILFCLTLWAVTFFFLGIPTIPTGIPTVFKELKNKILLLEAFPKALVVPSFLDHCKPVVQWPFLDRSWNWPACKRFDQFMGCWDDAELAGSRRTSLKVYRPEETCF